MGLKELCFCIVHVPKTCFLCYGKRLVVKAFFLYSSRILPFNIPHQIILNGCNDRKEEEEKEAVEVGIKSQCKLKLHISLHVLANLHPVYREIKSSFSYEILLQGESLWFEYFLVFEIVFHFSYVCETESTVVQHAHSNLFIPTAFGEFYNCVYYVFIQIT